LLALVVALTVGVYVFIPTATAHAMVPERPTVAQVKMFKCWAENGSCPGSIESEANAWMQDVLPPGRILERQLRVTERHVVLAIFYEVPVWRTKQKLPAEQP
jgi:hypothetical protein